MSCKPDNPVPDRVPGLVCLCRRQLLSLETLKMYGYGPGTDYWSMQTTPIIGTLLLRAGMVQKEALEESARMATWPQKIGRVLLMYGYLNERDLRSSLLAQSLIGRGMLDFETAVEALRIAYRQLTSLEEALLCLGFRVGDWTPGERLAPVRSLPRGCKMPTAAEA